MTFITCSKCGFVDTIGFMDVTHNPKTGEWKTTSPRLRWRCPRCGGKPELDVVTIFSEEDVKKYNKLRREENEL